MIPAPSAPKNGGPAFPYKPSREEPVSGGCFRLTLGDEPGMTLRDYFVAHAPAEPAPWFCPEVTERPKHPVQPDTRDLTPPAVEELAGLGEWLDAADIEDPKVRAYAEARSQYHVDIAAWNKMVTRERYLQWPGAWADEMLKRRGGA